MVFQISTTGYRYKSTFLCETKPFEIFFRKLVVRYRPQIRGFGGWVCGVWFDHAILAPIRDEFSIYAELAAVGIQ